ncbi:MAG: sulfite exporter TauE/SafE family protein [Planctomycetes bacterium]|nr:sulfite exporter TauE/SafE family protein [Planctomycetota bacterium]
MLGIEWMALLWGGLSALLIGFSKTGMPGAAIPAVALMAEAFREETKLSVGAMLPILLVGDLFALAYYRRHAHWGRLVELFPYVVAGMVPGYMVLGWAPSGAFSVLLGTIILILLGLQVARQGFGWQPLPNRRWVVGVTGLLAGFGTTVGNAAGPVMSIYLIGQRMDKQQFLGTAAWFFFLVNASKFPWFLALGVITRQTLRLDALLVPIVVLGALSGVLLVKRIPQSAFNVLVLLLAGIAALRLVLS